MSLPVELSALRERVDEYGTVAFLITAAGDGPPHVVSVRLRWDGDHLVVPVGRSSRAAVERQPGVTLVWPPVLDPAYCMIVDATLVSIADDGSEVTVEPTNGVLHRMADAGDDVPYCRPVSEV